MDDYYGGYLRLILYKRLYCSFHNCDTISKKETTHLNWTEKQGLHPYFLDLQENEGFQ